MTLRWISFDQKMHKKVFDEMKYKHKVKIDLSLKKISIYY